MAGMKRLLVHVSKLVVCKHSKLHMWVSVVSACPTKVGQTLRRGLQGRLVGALGVSGVQVFMYGVSRNVATVHNVVAIATFMLDMFRHSSCCTSVCIWQSNCFPAHFAA